VFTGLVEAVGRLRRIERRGPSALLVVEAPFEDLALGDSVAVSGACLTVTRTFAGGFDADLSAETLSLTTLGKLGAGAKVNLERASKVGGRLGGHMVLGHVDGLGRLTERTPVGEAHRVTIEVPASLAAFVAAKGSVAIDGTSLTVNDVADGPTATRFSLMLIPHTLGATTLQDLRTGDWVNVEVDVLARYVARQIEVAALLTGAGRPHNGPDEPSRGTSADDRLLDKLQRGGW
jgi:riboflavin synthase